MRYTRSSETRPDRPERLDRAWPNGAPTMLAKIIYATLAILAVGAAAQAQPPGTLAPKGLIINRDSSGHATSARTIGGNAPGTSTTTSGLSGSGFGGSGLFQ